VNSLFHETKIPTVDMKIHVYFNFSKTIWKKIKSPSSMRDGRFHPSKCRGKASKNGSVVYPFFQNARPFFITPKKRR
jgi:hypothetical protein